MNNSPNFALQVREVEQQLKSEWQLVQEGWRDNVAVGFEQGVIQPYTKNFQQYLTGEGINGYGVEQLMQQMDKHLQDMSSVAGYSEPVPYSGF